MKLENEKLSAGRVMIRFDDETQVLMRKAMRVRGAKNKAEYVRQAIVQESRRILRARAAAELESVDYATAQGGSK